MFKFRAATAAPPQVIDRVPPASLSLIYESNHATLHRCITLLPQSAHAAAVAALLVPSAIPVPGKLRLRDLEPRPLIRARNPPDPPTKWNTFDKAALLAAVAAVPPAAPYTDAEIDAWWFSPATSIEHEKPLADIFTALAATTRLRLPSVSMHTAVLFMIYVPKLKHLRTLILDDAESAAGAVAMAGDKCSGIETLIAYRAGFGERTPFLSVVPNVSTLTRLVFDSSFRIHARPTRPAGNCLRALSGSLRVVEFHQCFADHESGPVLRALAGLPHLRQLALVDNMFDEDDQFGDLVPLFRSAHGLQALRLEDFTVPPLIEEGLVGAWAQCGGLTSLTLCGWNCSRCFWPAFAVACTTLTALQVLRSQVGGITADDGRCLAEALREMTSLRYLDLGRNELEGAAVDVARAVAAHPLLTRLRLHGTEMDEADALQIAAELPKMTMLDALDLTGTPISEEGAQALAAAFDSLPRLRVVKLGERDVAEEGRAVLEAAGESVQAPLPGRGTPPEATPPPPDSELPHKTLISWAVAVWQIVED